MNVKLIIVIVGILTSSAVGGVLIANVPQKSIAHKPEVISTKKASPSSTPLPTVLAASIAVTSTPQPTITPTVTPSYKVVYITQLPTSTPTLTPTITPTPYTEPTLDSYSSQELNSQINLVSSLSGEEKTDFTNYENAQQSNDYQSCSTFSASPSALTSCQLNVVNNYEAIYNEAQTLLNEADQKLTTMAESYHVVALCKDHTFSLEVNRGLTCTQHGGVLTYIY